MDYPTHEERQKTIDKLQRRTQRQAEDKAAEELTVLMMQIRNTELLMKINDLQFVVRISILFNFAFAAYVLLTSGYFGG